MSNNESIHRRIIATGKEWKPCVECGKKLEAGEILTAIASGTNAGIVHWYCEKCTDRFFRHLIADSWRDRWRINRRDGSTETVDLNAARAAQYGDAG